MRVLFLLFLFVLLFLEFRNCFRLNSQKIYFSRKFRNFSSLKLSGEENFSEDTFSKLVNSLRIYSQIAKLHFIPIQFEIPKDDAWPENLHHFPLGKVLFKLISTRDLTGILSNKLSEISNLGFDLNLDIFLDDWDIFMIAIKSFKKVFNTVDVPLKFIIPNEKPWPYIIRGVKLGLKLAEIKTYDLDNEKLNQLRDIGIFIDQEKDQFNKVYQALEIYKNLIDENLQVASEFCVPYTKDWPSRLHGMKLGEIVRQIQQTNYLIQNDKERKILLEKIQLPLFDSVPNSQFPIISDYNLDKLNPETSNSVNSLSSSIKSRLKNLGIQISDPKSNDLDDIDSKFYFSGMHEKNPDVEIRAYDYRQKFYANLTSNNFEQRIRAIYNADQNLEKVRKVFFPDPDENESALFEYVKTLSYRFFEFGHYIWDDFYMALEIFKKKHDHLRIPLNFVINTTLEHNFPEHFNSMPLGEFCEAVRIGDYDGFYDTQRKSKLDKLGFLWGDENQIFRFPFHAFFLALRVYSHMNNGELIVPYNYVIQDDQRWPRWMVGIPIGKWYDFAKIQQGMIQRFYKERKEMLDTLDFVWWLPPHPESIKEYQKLNLK